MTDIVFETTQLPPAYDGVAYEASFAISGAASVFSACTVSSGSLPPGLSIAADHVRITGTPAGVAAVLPKTYTFKVTLTDTAGAVQSGTYTITVNEPQGNPVGYGNLSPRAQLASMWPGQYA